MNEYEIPYTNYIIRIFANRFHLSRLSAYKYLRDYKGLSFLHEFYDVEHLQDVEETVDDLVVKCNQQGGELV